MKKQSARPLPPGAAGTPDSLPAYAGITAIDAEIRRLATLERESAVAVRIGLGRCIIALQALTDERGDNGKPSFVNARIHVMKILGPDSHISENTLIHGTYVASRLNPAQVAVLLKSGASFSAIYAMLAELKNNSSVRRLICDVKAGREKDLNRFLRARNRRSVLSLGRRLVRAHGGDRPESALVDSIHTEEHVELLLSAVLARAKVLGLPWRQVLKTVIDRVEKLES